MLVIYNIGLALYQSLLFIASFVNNKAKLWLNGRRDQKVIKLDSSIWFHFASLGEFEQGRPVLEQTRIQYPRQPIVVTFFSPSGYEIRKDTPLADAVYYLPMDGAANARDFIGTINPKLAIFTKYEYWYHYFNELHKRHIPLYMISGIFRPGQAFFRWYSGVHKRMLKMVTWFFVQDIPSKHLLHDVGITNVTISGDTRFDRVWANAQHPRDLPEIGVFKNGQKLFIAGSTWPEDEQLLAALIKQHPDWKFIIAPHEISEQKLNSLVALLPKETTVRYSQLAAHHPTATTLIIDNIGMLSALYQYADIAYIGGGFGAGIHNTLEAAAFGMPIIFGPKYDKFKEARDLLDLNAAFTIGSQEELLGTTGRLMDDEPFRLATARIAKKYVEENIGATGAIMKYIAGKHPNL